MTAWHEMDVETTIYHSDIACSQIEGRHVPGSLQPGDNRWVGAHAERDFLGQPSGLAHLNHFPHHGESGTKAVVFGFNLGIGQQLLLQFGKGSHDLIS